MSLHACILIQGPLITFGQGPNINLKGFRSYDCVIENTLLILAKGITPVLCIWSADTGTAEYSSLERFYKEKGLSILIVDIPAKKDPDHRYKHHFAIYSGLEYCRANFDCTFFAKIRTDQHITEVVLDELMERSTSAKLLISELMPDNNFYMGDFVYAGKYDTMKRYLQSQLFDNQDQVKYSTIGTDLGLNYYRSWHKVSKWKLILSYLFASKESTKLWGSFINSHLVTLSVESWVTIKWRDKKMTDVVNPDNFLFVSGEDKVELIESRGLSKHIYYVKGKYKRLAKKVALKLIGK